MIRFLLRRLFILVVTLFGITVLTFLLTRLTPGDPATMRLAGAKGASHSSGAYEELIQLNRQNLGLDKPILLNFRFDTPEKRIDDAISEALRDTDFWRKSGERRLARYGPMALPPILDRLDKAADDADQNRLLELLPRVSGVATTATLTMSPDVQADWWRATITEKKLGVADSVGAKAAVDAYLIASDEGQQSALEAVRRHGGRALDPLMNALRGDSKQVPRIAAALESITSVSFKDEDPLAVRDRWEGWWRRNRAEFVDPTSFESATRIMTDTQFGVWIGQIMRLDFGESYVSRRPVSRMVGEALPISLLLSVLSIFFSYLLSIPIGVYSALKRHSPADRVITVILFVLYSLPSFWVAGILILTVTGPPFLTLFPTRGISSPGMELSASWDNMGAWLTDRAWHLVLPVFCLTYGSLAFISRQMRSAMLEVISQDFIRTAVAKGVPPHRVVWKHAVRNSLLPIITISAGILPELIAGAVIIESIFTIPGMGNLTFTAILNRDYPVINAVLLFSAFLTLLGILLADLAYSIADPRIEYR